MYMAGDDDDDDNEDDNDAAESSTNTGAGPRRKAKSDPAIYKSNGEEDDGILFSQPASWNNLAIVLRDGGVLRFTKYVSRSAKGDRWDVCAEFGVEFGEEEEGDE